MKLIAIRNFVHKEQECILRKLPIIILTVLMCFLFESTVAPVCLFSKPCATKKAKSRQKSSKKSKKSKKSGKSKKSKHNGRPQSIDQSLELLNSYYINPILDSTVSLLSEAPFANSLQGIIDPDCVFNNSELRDNLVENINSWLGTPYRHGGRTQNGIDCSNFTSVMMNETLGLDIPSSPGGQASLVEPIQKIEDLQFGDLVFFSGRSRRAHRIGHVGIYIGNGLFAHSSSGRGVIYTHISEGYYMERFRCGGRLYKRDFAQLH